MKRPNKIASYLGVLAFATAAGTMALGPPHAASLATKDTTEANITKLTAILMARSQFAHHPLDNELAGEFLDGYLDALDGTHSLFLQSDVDDFAKYRASLAAATRNGDTTAARAIFDRYLKRQGQRVAADTDALRADHFDFTGHDSYALDREHTPRPRDLPEARALWQEQLRAEYLQEKLNGKKPSEIATSLTRRHTQELRTMKALSDDEVLEVYLNALVHVYDPHSDYLGHEQMDSLSISMNLSLVGIGASLTSENGACEIRELLPGGPAARGGVLKPGDRIIAVAQAGKEPVDIVDMPLSRAVELIRGPKGTTVTLTVVPSGAADGAPPKVVPLVRDEVRLEDEEAKARIVDLPNGDGKTLRVGVVDLPSFYADMNERRGGESRSVTADVARLITKLKAEGVRGLVIDLRHNGGGSLKEAINLTGLFIDKGPVVQTRGPEGAVEVDADADPTVLYDGPLVLLTSRFSASASEIMTGALEDYGRALVVGDASTFGKGTVQDVLPLAQLMDRGGLSHTFDPGALKITILKFYRPSGASTQLRGVKSDIVLPSPSDFSDVSESALKDPLPWDTVSPAPHEQLNRVQPYVGALRDQSLRRVAANPAFAHLASDADQVRKTLKSKSISLNEADRRVELSQSKAREDEREKDLNALRARQPTTYEITVENASTSGLPQPTVPKTPAVRPSSATTDAERERQSTTDLLLDETLHILADYVALKK